MKTRGITERGRAHAAIYGRVERALARYRDAEKRETFTARNLSCEINSTTSKAARILRFTEGVHYDPVKQAYSFNGDPIRVMDDGGIKI